MVITNNCATYASTGTVTHGLQVDGTVDTVVTVDISSMNHFKKVDSLYSHKDLFFRT